MTDDVTTWVLSVLQVGTALGITLFWVTWLRGEHDEPWLPDGYVEHERAFVLPDAVLALLLTLSAILSVSGHPLGRDVALITVGMLTFLGLLDLVYFARTGLFARERGGVGNVALVIWLLVFAVVLAVHHLAGAGA
jgi:hypothetical protein